MKEFAADLGSSGYLVFSLDLYRKPVPVPAYDLGFTTYMLGFWSLTA